MKNKILLAALAVTFVFGIISCGESLGSLGGGGGSSGSGSSINIEMVQIPEGTFTMGSPASETGRFSDEGPQHEVTLSAFKIGKYQVTQEQYQKLMGSNPSFFTKAVSGESETPEKLPVEQVSWYDALVFCNKLSIAEGLEPVYSISGKTNPSEWGSVPESGNATWDAAVMDKSKSGYRLPTEAQWEYACRAGTTTAYNIGDSISNNTGWYSANSDYKTHQVGLKPANAWGLHDMHGNVREWCWAVGYYTDEPLTDPGGAVSGDIHMVRGGSFYCIAANVRSAFRDTDYYDNGKQKYRNGFRLALP